VVLAVATAVAVVPFAAPASASIVSDPHPPRLRVATSGTGTELVVKCPAGYQVHSLGAEITRSRDSADAFIAAMVPSGDVRGATIRFNTSVEGKAYAICAPALASVTLVVAKSTEGSVTAECAAHSSVFGFGFDMGDNAGMRKLVVGNTTVQAALPMTGALAAYAICGKRSGLVVGVHEESHQPKEQSSKSVALTCPDGTEIGGTGVEIDTTVPVVLDEVEPDEDLSDLDIAGQSLAQGRWFMEGDVDCVLP
jgi:hypothetical protein